MIRLTAPDLSEVSIDASLVDRARRAVSGERENGAQSRIDWAIMSLVLETIDDVAIMIKGEVTSFTFLTSRDGSKIWFNARKVIGPLPIGILQQNWGFASSIKLMNYRQYVIENHEQVRQVILAAGGTPLGD